MNQEKVTAVILDAVREYNQQLPAGQRIPETPDVTLFGRDGHLDSLGLVNLILMVEEHLQDECHVQLTLADERAMSQNGNPFRSVQTLSAYVHLLLNESHDG